MKIRAIMLVTLFFAGGLSGAEIGMVPKKPAQEVAGQLASDAAEPLESAWIATTDSSRQDLERRRLILEIEKLNKDVSGWNKNLLIQAGTLFVAFVAALASTLIAANAARLQAKAATAQNENQRRENVSNLLKELGSESMLVRSAAIQALSRYEEATPFLINTLRSEQSPDVLSSTIVSLGGHPDRAIVLLLEMSRHIYDQKLGLAARLAALGLERRDVAQEFSLRNKDVMRRQESGAGRRTVHAMSLALSGPNASQEDPNIAQRQDARSQMDAAFRAHANCIRALESLLGSGVFKGRPLSLAGAYLSGIQLDRVDVSSWDFSRSCLDRASFRDCRCVSTNFEKIEAKDISFRGSMLTGAIFDYSDLLNIDLRDVSGVSVRFKGATIREARIDRAELYSAVFCDARIGTSDIRNSDLRSACFIRTKLFETTFDTCRMSGSRFDSASLVKVKLRSLRCRRANFTATSFVEVFVFKGSFLGSVYHGSQWKKTRVRLTS